MDLGQRAQYDHIFKDPTLLLASIANKELRERLEGGTPHYLESAREAGIGPSGALAAVYPYETATGWLALRCYVDHQLLRPLPVEALVQHYHDVNAFFRDPARPELRGITVEATCYADGIVVPGVGTCPLVVMEWVHGKRLLDFLEDRCTAEDRPALEQAAEHWRAVVRILAEAEVEHGDLSGSNVLVRERDRHLVLVDYDFVRLPGKQANLLGLTGRQNAYCHPALARIARDGTVPSAWPLDTVPAAVIDATLQVVSVRPAIWRELSHRDGGQRLGGKRLLFTPAALADPDVGRTSDAPDSPVVFPLLEGIADGEARRALATLREVCYRRPTDLPRSLQDLLVAPATPDEPLRAYLEGKALVVSWTGPIEQLPPKVAIAWQPDRPPETLVGVEYRPADRDQLLSPFTIYLGDVPPAELYVALLPSEERLLPTPPSERQIASAPVRSLCQVTCSLATVAGTTVQCLTIETTEPQRSLPPLVVVRRVGGPPSAAFGHRPVVRIPRADHREAESGLADQLPGMELQREGQHLVRLNFSTAHCPELLPPNTWLGVFPAKPDDDAWVDINVGRNVREHRPPEYVRSLLFLALLAVVVALLLSINSPRALVVLIAILVAVVILIVRLVVRRDPLPDSGLRVS